MLATCQDCFWDISTLWIHDSLKHPLHCGYGMNEIPKIKFHLQRYTGTTEVGTRRNRSHSRLTTFTSAYTADSSPLSL